MKDRIRQIMESQKMTQQNFSQFLGISSAALSSIFNGRTKPTLNIVEAIHRKLPQVNMLWLLYGEGESLSPSTVGETTQPEPVERRQGGLQFDFEDAPQEPVKTPSVHARRTVKEPADVVETMKNPDNAVRHIIEIKVYYDDLTYESFVPKRQ